LIVDQWLKASVRCAPALGRLVEVSAAVPPVAILRHGAVVFYFLMVRDFSRKRLFPQPCASRFYPGIHPLGRFDLIQHPLLRVQLVPDIVVALSGASIWLTCCLPFG